MANVPATARGRGWQASTWNSAADWRRWEQVGLAPTLTLNDVLFNWLDRRVTDLDVKAAVTGMSFERSIEGASTLTVTVRDPRRHLFSQAAGRTRVPAPKTPRRKRNPVDVDEAWEPIMPPGLRGNAMEVQLDGWIGRLVKVGYVHSTSEVTLTFEDRTVYWLRRKKGELKVSRAASTRAEFVLRLFREIKAVTVPFVCPELHTKQAIGKASADTRDTRYLRGRRHLRAVPSSSDSSATADPNGGGGFPAGAKLTVKGQPANSAQRGLMDGILTEARSLGANADVMAACLACAIQESTMGADAHMTGNDDVGIFQQGRNWIPEADVMNPRLTTNAFLLSGTPSAKGKGSAPGWKVKHGSLTKMPGSMEAAIKAVQVSIGGYAPWEREARAAVKAWGGPTAEGDAGTTTGGKAKAYQYTRNKDEDSWTAIQRLAVEVGWRCFMVGQAAYFMSEQDLFGRRARYQLTPDSPALLEFTYDVDWGRPVSEASMTVALDRWGAPPGSVVLLDGFGPPDGRWLVTGVQRDWFTPTAEISLKQPGKQKLEPAHEKTERAAAASAGGGTGASRGKVTTDGGARGIVEQAFEIAKEAGGDTLYVGSDLRPNSITTSGNVSDHSRNDATQAARDIGVRGIDLITGPPSPKLDKAVVAIGKAFGRNYGSGTSGPFQNADNIQFEGYRIQIIWRTPKYGGHMGHIHVGAKRGG
jgi:hypothetical protein